MLYLSCTPCYVTLYLTVAAAVGKACNLAASVVNGKMGDGGSMASHLPNLSVGAALPQQDVPLQPPAGTQAEGLAVGKAVDAPPVRCHRVQHLAPGQVCDLDAAV